MEYPMKAVDKDSWVDGYRYAIARNIPPAPPRKEAEHLFNQFFGITDDPLDAHGISGLFNHERGKPCIVCDRVK